MFLSRKIHLREEGMFSGDRVLNVSSAS